MRRKFKASKGFFVVRDSGGTKVRVALPSVKGRKLGEHTESMVSYAEHMVTIRWKRVRGGWQNVEVRDV